MRDESGGRRAEGGRVRYSRAEGGRVRKEGCVRRAEGGGIWEER